MSKIESYKHDGCTITLYYDEDGGDSTNPRDWDGASPMVLSHRHYDFPNDAGVDFEAFGSWAEVRTHLIEECGATIILPVGMHDHSGVSLWAGAEDAHSVRGDWDSGQLGFVYVTDEVLRTWGHKLPLTPERRASLVEGMAGEVEEYGAWINGEVYGFVVEDPGGETYESCWGFVGSYGFDEAKREAEGYCQGAREEYELHHSEPWYATQLINAMVA